MSVATLAPRWTAAAAPRPTENLAQLLDHDFLARIGWNADLHVLAFPAEHHIVGWRQCRTDGCRKRSRGSEGHCGGCLPDPVTGTRTARQMSVGVGPCAVPRCARPWQNSPTQLCSSHLAQQKTLGLPLEHFVSHPRVKGLASFGACQVGACPRDRDGRESRYCPAHRRRWNRAVQANPKLDESVWRRTMTAISECNEVSLRGLPQSLRVEILYGVQERVKADVKTTATTLRSLVNLAREQRSATLEAINVPVTVKPIDGLRNTMLRFVQLGLCSAESEVFKDVWTGAVFGIRGYLRFGGITQAWLKEATKKWTADDLPRHRGWQVHVTMQARIKAIARLSESLSIQRRDGGESISQLGRADIVTFLHRLAYQNDVGQISAKVRYETCLHVRYILSGMRALGMTRQAGLLQGLPEDFALRIDDIPAMPEPSESGRDLPVEIMRQICTALPQLEQAAAAEPRVAIELLIDTGRRPVEICKLEWDCLERDEDGQPVLVYDNIKANRLGRRLPISEFTATLITAQKKHVRQRFPDTAIAQLRLLPSPVANPHGRRSISVGHLSSVHKEWITQIPQLRMPDDTEFDRAAIVPYAYRHTYAQRHADAGVPIDVLRDLLDHRQLTTTQGYYRVGEQRRRDAVDRVADMQFDRHGARVWRSAKTLLDSEHIRRAVGEVAVPYGLCSEPSNVAAGGHDCPVRFRCVGCGHFRTDVSYLPDLQAYLADLLRNRERIIAAVDVDDWARTEATPSDDEIQRVRRLIDRVSGDLDDLPDTERRHIDEAVAILRTSRTSTVALGLPRHRQPRLDIRPAAAE